MIRYCSTNNIKGKDYIDFLEYYYKKANIITFHLEGYTEKIRSENEISEIYETLVKPYTSFSKDNYVSLIISNEKKNVEIMKKINNELLEYKNDLIKCYYSNQYVETQYGNTKIFAFKFTENILKYLKTACSLFDWCNEKPSDLTFYKDEKCLLTSTAHEGFLKYMSKMAIKRYLKKPFIKNVYFLH